MITLATLVIPLSRHISYKQRQHNRSNKCSRFHLNLTSMPSLKTESLIDQNGSGTKFSTFLHRSTTNPRVGNWQDPVDQFWCFLGKTITDKQLLFSNFSDPCLEGHGLETSEGSADAQIELESCVYCCSLSVVQSNGMLRRVNDVSTITPVKQRKYALSRLLNLARLT